ncbi:DUF423 domain-containing protein [Paenibacillus sp. y28]|uniref:DUF423 domain-containing protein n=1 Tax=Paenibacillus sp. y28 TaxID=3129110 RepID=UPI003019677D
MNKTWFIIGCINAFLCIAIGAFGAHALKSHVGADLIAIYETGVQYHMFHALGLIAIALAADKLGSGWRILWSARLMLIGIILFSGSLYALAISGVKGLGAITPLGGVSFLAAWVLLAMAAAGAGRSK